MQRHIEGRSVCLTIDRALRVKRNVRKRTVSQNNLRKFGLPYYIETADGRVHFGRLDASGTLPRVYTGDDAGSYTVHWGDDAIAKHLGE